MARARSRLWLMVVLFAVLGVIVGISYLSFRAGDIEMAEGKRAYDAGRFDQAEAAFLLATELEPTNPNAWYWLGISRKNQGKSGPAADALREATKLASERLPWWFEYAEALQWAQRFAEAEDAWGGVLSRLPEGDPRVPQVRMNIAWAIANQNEMDRAVENLKESLAKTNDPNIRDLLAKMLAWSNRFEEAEKILQQPLNSQPEN